MHIKCSWKRIMHWCKSGYTVLNNSELGLGFLLSIHLLTSLVRTHLCKSNTATKGFGSNCVWTMLMLCPLLWVKSQGISWRDPLGTSLSACILLSLTTYPALTPENQCRKAGPLSKSYTAVCGLPSLTMLSVTPNRPVSNNAISQCLQSFLYGKKCNQQ